MSQGLAKSRIRVAHYTLGLDVGGQERLLVEMVRHADQARFDLSVVVQRSRGPLADAIEAGGARLLVLNEPCRLRPGLPSRLARLFRQERFDVVHTHDDGALTYGMPAAWWAGVPRRIHTHHHGRLAAIGRRRRWLVRWASAFAQHFVCASHDSARYMIEQGVAARRVQTVWNGIDLNRYAFQGPCATGPVVTVSRLSPEKDVANLVHAARHVLSSAPEVRFEIAGDGPCRGELERLARELGVADRLMFLGAVHDIPALLARARLFVLPSQSEGISLTLLEAMARGLPLVATQVGGNVEVVEAGVTGLLVSARDPEALAQAIRKILADPDAGARMGRAGRERVEKYFDIRHMMRQYEALYDPPQDH